MYKIYFLLLFTIILISCKQGNNQGIEIEWIANLEGNFSFSKQWDYPEYIFTNEYGQLVCDGICPSEIDNMRDNNGRIIEDSLLQYYQYVDTTRLYHTIDNEANTYEWAGTNQIKAYKGESDTVKCYTLCNAATHSSLEINIIGDKCYSRIVLNSIKNRGTEYFECKSGYIKIDKYEFENGKLKAEFNLDFIHPDNSEIPMWWNGKIYSKIEERN